MSATAIDLLGSRLVTRSVQPGDWRRPNSSRALVAEMARGLDQERHATAVQSQFECSISVRHGLPHQVQASARL